MSQNESLQAPQKQSQQPNQIFNDKICNKPFPLVNIPPSQDEQEEFLEQTNTQQTKFNEDQNNVEGDTEQLIEEEGQDIYNQQDGLDQINKSVANNYMEIEKDRQSNLSRKMNSRNINRELQESLNNKDLRAENFCNDKNELCDECDLQASDIQQDFQQLEQHIEEQQEQKENLPELDPNSLDKHSPSYKLSQISVKKSLLYNLNQKMSNPESQVQKQPSPDKKETKEQTEAQQMVKKVSKQRKEIEKRRQEEMERQLQDLQEKLEKEKTEREIQKQQQILERKEKIQQRLDEQKLRKQQRQDIEKKSAPILNELLPNKKQQENEQTLLEKRKLELAEKRQLMYKPQIQQEQKEKYVPQKSVFTHKIIEEEKLRKLKELNEAKERQESLNRRFQYGKHVKQSYMPKTQPQFNPNPYREDEGDNIMPEIPNQTTGQARSLSGNNFIITQQKKRTTHSLQRKIIETNQQRLNKFQIEQNNSNGDDTTPQKTPKNFPPRKPKEFKPLVQDLPPLPKKQNNYLQQMRSKRMEKEQNQDNRSQSADWNQISQDVKNDNGQNLDKIINKVSKLEEDARRKEKNAIKNKQYDQVEQVDEMYVNSIKTKLALLDKMKQ